MMDPAHKCPEGWNATQLLAYVEGELEAASCRQLEQHVRDVPLLRGRIGIFAPYGFPAQDASRVISPG